ncbi:site-specific DNA-methyltransferase [Pseudomonadales bacterium]|nr:site-specific DNA-methyltransferase [Pseudomonadales bacterium]
MVNQNTLGRSFFSTDENFNSHEFMHFCSKMMRKEPKQRGKAPCMIVFCSFEQQFGLIELAKKFGINNYINLVFRKNYSSQVLKANMRVVGNSEYALLMHRNELDIVGNVHDNQSVKDGVIVGNSEHGLILYREKLPMFNNNGKMIMNTMDWMRDDKRHPMYRKLHPTQKPLALLEKLISIFTDEGDVVIDPTAGSGSTIIAAENLGRKAYGFEIDRHMHPKAKEWIRDYRVYRDELAQKGYSETEIINKAGNQVTIFNPIGE